MATAAKEYPKYHSTKPLIPPRVHEHVTPQNDPHQPPRLHIVRSTRDRPFDAITARWREAALDDVNGVIVRVSAAVRPRAAREAKQLTTRVRLLRSRHRD